MHLGKAFLSAIFGAIVNRRNFIRISLPFDVIFDLRTVELDKNLF